ncbi:alanine--tRNA ligase [Philodulcilactobacillus myokoensis]|uniref:Alanine--tRNA ligase n=1 Tax=Philodulcilactobacillus myokoensis TaxID=2929573 RepID=A0A9W6B0F7_9LACO|nr:alanine--tRNA ligase [Philodulcilactobacillus myokoensis]GLB46682.1 alanine--tRNA ligase [Philodulcilactobacillus myokoensis]
MKNLSSGQVRSMFLNFFKQHGHTIEPSASLIPQHDPSLLWINSGVATMKKYFDGSVVPSNRRLTSSQKSIRTNDIENVGKTARHQTLFEMLGNFSVGDYFKKEAISWAFELLTSPKWFGWDKNNLYMTVYPKDKDAIHYWEKAGVAPDHIVKIEDNFWDVGQGPSGPDSEIFYDRGKKFTKLADDDPENYPGGENGRYLEVWNIVFSQFNHKPDGTYEPLPRKNIDTGMGLERVVSIFQNAPTNFETDLFLPIIHKTEELSDHQKYDEKDTKKDVAFKIIADHARAITFAIGDGALPSNVGRGYVIRRLIRRATVAGHELGIDDAFLYKLVPVVGHIMESYYPDVLEQSDYISKVIHSEEKRFNETLNDGLKLFNHLIKQLKASNKTEMSGKDAFKLYDTYGFPFELTSEYVHDENLSVDEHGFNNEMQKQRDRARKARGNDMAMGIQRDLLVDLKVPSKYVGYHQLTVNDTELETIIVNDKFVDHVDAGKKAELIFKETPFYAEMGGQVADTGVIKQGDQVVAKVGDVQHAPNKQNLHSVKVLKPMKKGTKYTLVVDQIRHSKIEMNHTATHLLDQSLRNVLGSHTQQAGSLVAPHYLRFDFNHFGQVTDHDLAKVESMVNQQIFKEIPVKTVITDPKSGKEMGAVAIFSNKYGKKVRVVQIGDFSIEFCGGTHVKNTDALGMFKIISESGVGAGVRRIEAVTSSDAFDYLNREEQILKQTASQLKVSKVENVLSRVDQLQNQVKTLEQKQASLESKVAERQASDVFKNTSNINGVKLITGIIKNSKMTQLRQLADTWRSKKLSDVLVLGTSSDGKANLIAAVSDDQVKSGLKAGDIIKTAAKEINGGGGGRPNLAQAGGKKPAGLDKAMKAVKDYISKK